MNRLGNANPSGPGAEATASLYIGDLNLDVTEALLYDIFNAVGPVASIKVCRDSQTQRSLGYAYVNFHNAVDAERAIDTMNFTFIRGRPCRMMWSNRDKTIRENGLGNIVIKNLDKSIDNKTLYDTFSMFGSILSCKIGTNRETNESLGYGFVHYSDPEAAKKAIERIDGMVIAEKKVTVEVYANSKSKFEQESENFTNVYAKGIPKTWTESQCREAMEEWGEIENCLIPCTTEGTSLGYLYCNFATHEQAVACCEGLEGSEVDGSTISANRALSKKERRALRSQRAEEGSNKKVNLYVKNLAQTIDDDTLKELFEAFGTTTSCKVMLTEAGQSRGFGFVNYEDQSSASKAMAEMNGKPIEGKELYVGLAQKRSERKQMLQQKFTVQPPMHQGGFYGRMPQMNQRMGTMGMPPMGMPMMRGMVPMSPYGMPTRTSGAPMGLNFQQLANKTSVEQKQIIGEKLYSRVQKVEPKKAGKITGMLLEMDQTELLMLLENEQELIRKINEALMVLRNHSME